MSAGGGEYGNHLVHGVVEEGLAGRYGHLTVPKLRQELKIRGLSSKGLKRQLVGLNFL